MTGAGRSTAAKELEDLGFYVVDNLPPTPARATWSGWSTRASGVRAADRGRGRRPLRRRSSSRSQANLAQGATGRRTTLLFLEADDDVLVRRQEAARRPHPLQGDGRLLDGLAARAGGARPTCAATPTWSSTPPTSTSTSSPTRSPRRSAPEDATGLRITVVSFGFKYGIPVDADFVADMRFLPNPLLGARAAAADRPRRRRRRLRAGPGRRRGVPRPLRARRRDRRRRLPRARASAS